MEEEDFPYTFQEWLSTAERRLEPDKFDVIIDGSGTEASVRNNSEAFDRLKMMRRVLRGLEKCDLSTKILGAQMAAPLLLDPVAALTRFHPDGEIGVAEAAREMGIPMVLSAGSATPPLEEVGSAMGDAPHWFQVFLYRDRNVITDLIKRAEASRFSAIVVTVDSEAPGWRIRTMKKRFHGRELRNANLKTNADPGPATQKDRLSLESIRRAGTWQDFEFVRRSTDLPLLIKGITNPLDASLAIEHGADGIIVSNHGGRQLDHEIATIDALPMIREVVGKTVPILLDGGVRQSTDALKALAMGASAVLIGRLYVCGLAVGGKQGVKRVLENFLDEMHTEMLNLGCKNIEETHSIRLVTSAPTQVIN